MSHMMSAWGIGFLGGLGMLILWGLIIGLVIWLIATLTRLNQSTTGRNAAVHAALDILRRRLAAGDITPQEYEELRRGLET